MNRNHKEEQLHKLKNTLRKNNVYTLHYVFQYFLVMSLSLSLSLPPACVSMYFLTRYINSNLFDVLTFFSDLASGNSKITGTVTRTCCKLEQNARTKSRTWNIG